jgi:hypothetical protein
MARRPLVCALVVLALLTPASASGKKPLHVHHPHELSTFPATNSMAAVGEQDAGGGVETGASYTAQSFVMPRTGRLRTLSFQLRSLLGPDGVDFRVLVTEVEGAQAPGASPSLIIGAILYESPSMTLPPGSDWTTFEINLDGLLLTKGTTYFWIIDTWTDHDGIIGTAEIGITEVDYVAGDIYSGGALAANPASDPGTREDHLTDPVHFYSPFSGVDLAFSLTWRPGKGRL